MASIISGNINLSKIDKSKIYEGKKGKYYPVTVVINNEVGEYGDSGYIMTEQTKEQREAKEQKSYLIGHQILILKTELIRLLITLKKN